MKTLYLSVDTSGKFLFREPVGDPEQPHLVRLAWVVADDDQIIDEKSCLIAPRPDWDYEDDAVVAHGVLRETAVKAGVPLERAMAMLISRLDDVERVVGFNVDFVVKVLQRSALECGHDGTRLFDGKRVECAMRRATDIVRVPRMAPGGGWSWPKLKTAYEFFALGEELPPLDTDPIIRGILLARCVYTIDRGIIEHLRSTPHE
jgi:hypothetical protein